VVHLPGWLQCSAALGTVFSFKNKSRGFS